MHARPICSCLAQARSSRKLCHFPLFSPSRSKMRSCWQISPLENRSGRQAAPHPFIPLAFKITAVSLAAGGRDKSAGLWSFFSSSAGRKCSVKCMTLEPASFKGRQQHSQPQLGQTGPGEVTGLNAAQQTEDKSSPPCSSTDGRIDGTTLGEKPQSLCCLHQHCQTHPCHWEQTGSSLGKRQFCSQVH